MSAIESAAGTGWAPSRPAASGGASHHKNVLSDDSRSTSRTGIAIQVSQGTSSIDALERSVQMAVTAAAGPDSAAADAGVIASTQDYLARDADFSTRYCDIPVQDVVDVDAVARWLDVRGADNSPRDPLWWGIILGSDLGDEVPPCPAYSRPGAQTGSWTQPYRPTDGTAIYFDHYAEDQPGNYDIHFHHAQEPGDAVISDLVLDHVDPAPPVDWSVVDPDEVFFAHGCATEHRRGRVVEPGLPLIARWKELKSSNTDERLNNRFGESGMQNSGGNPGTGPGGDDGDSGWESDGPWITIPTRKVYHMHHIIDLKLLPGEVSTDVVSMSIAFNRNNTAAVFSAEILGGAWGDALTETDGEPKVVRAEIDGWTYEFIVDTWAESRRFGQVQLTVSGFAKNSTLGGRFYLPGHHVQPLQRTMAQLAEEAITGDWTMVWNAADWTVEGGAWSYSGLKPLDALGRLALAAGGYVECDAATKTIYVNPAYSVLPWNFDATAPEYIIPEHVLTGRTREMPTPEQANRIFISGAEVGGILVQATRVGSDGGLEAPIIQDPLYTHVDGARARAERELAALHQPPLVGGFRLPFDNVDIPYLAVGSFVEVALATPVRGVVSAVQLNVTTDDRGAVNVEQTIALGEPPANLYTGLRNIAAGPPLEVATVDSVNGDGTVVVTYPGGGQARPRAAGGEQAGDNVWIRGNEVQGQAPNLGAPIAILI